ncbi:MAG: hypothetical protein H0U12_07230 [Thermoleophilaceae bacterium]|nr:hypothetical protein [Thermoleophilaceae bacterium]
MTPPINGYALAGIPVSEEVRRDKPCLARIANHGGWCLLADGHEGDHLGRPTIATPAKGDG